MGCTLSTDKSKPVGAPVKKCIPLKLVQQICEIIKANAAFIPVLSRINDEELDLMVQCMERRTINSGDVVHKQGSPSDLFSIVFSGELEMQTEDFVLIGRIYPEECAGEIEFLYNAPYAATYFASKRSIIYSLSRADFERIADSIPVFFRQLDLFVTLENREEVFPFCSISKYAIGETVVNAGDPDGLHFFVVVTGKLVQERNIDHNIIKKNEYFGELSFPQVAAEFRQPSVFQHNIIAMEPSIILSISSEGLHRPDIQVKFAGFASTIIRRLQERQESESKIEPRGSDGSIVVSRSDSFRMRSRRAGIEKSSSFQDISNAQSQVGPNSQTNIQDDRKRISVIKRKTSRSKLLVNDDEGVGSDVLRIRSKTSSASLLDILACSNACTREAATKSDFDFEMG